MDTRLICVEHDKKDKRVSIVFGIFDNDKSIRFEEAILEEHEFYDLVKNILVKWER